jgi:Rho-binding antiterminator
MEQREGVNLFTMSTINLPSMLTPFEASIHETFSKKQYSKITFFNEYNEFNTVDTLIKSILNSESGESIELNSGEVVPLKKVVSINGVYSDSYQHIQDFTCDC